jgi:hypothetical protein
MATVTTTSLHDALPTSVPKLEASGLNWAIFLVRFRDAVDAKGFWGHFDGTTLIPDLSIPPTKAETTAKVQWEKDERSARSLLTQKLPDSTLMKVHMKTTVRERWEAVVKEYTEKGAYAQTDMRAKFLASRCPDKGNVRDFLDELRTKREELVQVGVDIDEKDYLSTIISSLPLSLSSFASANLAAARMFSPTKSIDPDVLMSLLMEEAERQKAQVARRRGSGKGADEDKPGEALSSEGSKPRKGKGRANVTCWTCNKKGHYQNECKEPKPEDVPKGEGQTTPVSQGPIAATAELASEDCGAWSVLPVEEDWFERAVAEMDVQSRRERVLADEVPVRDWFYEVAEVDDESEDEGTSSGDVSVDGFDSDAFEGTNPEDLGVTSQIGPVCNDDFYEGADMLSNTQLGPCQDETQVAPVLHPEGEFRGGGTTSESSGRLPDLDIYEIPWINATMEWRTHPIEFRASAEAVTHSSGEPKGGEVDADVQVHGSCDVGVIEMSRELDGLREEFAVCEGYQLVLRFEGEEGIRAETMDLPIGSPAPIESPVAEIYDPDDFALKSMRHDVVGPSSCVVNHSVGCVKFFEGADTPQLEWVVPFVFFSRLEPYLAIRTYEMGQRVVMSICRGGGLTLDDVGHLVRPPGDDFEQFESCSLIVVVDACHTGVMCQVICIFW